MKALSKGQDEIVAESGVTISNPDNPFIPVNENYNSQTDTYNISKCKYNIIISNNKGYVARLKIWLSFKVR